MTGKKTLLAAARRASALSVENPAQRVESARYAVLRRLTPCLRHEMVKFLQPISMIYEIIHHRRSAAEPDLQTLSGNADKMSSYARLALQQCHEVSTWMAPDADATISVGNGLRECVELMRAGLGFRGYQLVNEVGNIDFHVMRDALRMVLTSAFMAATDALRHPAKLCLSVEACNETHITIALTVQASEGGHTESYDDGYRRIGWRDVEALATAEDVGMSLEGSRLAMVFSTRPSSPSH